MKQNVLLAGLLAVLSCWCAPAGAQESPVAAAAQREEMEANFKRMNAKVEQLEETLQTQQKRMAALVEEIHSLRDEVDRLKTRNESAATQESIKRLAEKVEEVDKKRIADNELVISQLRTLGKALSKPIVQSEPKAAPVTPKVDKPAPAANAPQENGWTYQIKDGDTLSRIVTDMRAQGKLITQKQVMDANPKVNWNKLRIGQTVFIPQPAP